MDISQMVIMVTGTTIEPYAQNWKECRNTWVPVLRNMGYHVYMAIGNPDLENYYKIEEDIIWFKADDTKYGLYDKSIRLPIKWILEETGYQYYFRIDSDSFVAPKRFDAMIKQNFREIPNINYMGCCHPYDGWNPHELQRLQVCKEGYIASGCGYLVSKYAMQVAQEKMRIVEDPLDYTIDDWVLGRAMWENGIHLLHDSRILFESPFKSLMGDPKGMGVPYIGDPESSLAIQHYMNGHMVKAMLDLGYKTMKL